MSDALKIIILFISRPSVKYSGFILASMLLLISGFTFFYPNESLLNMTQSAGIIIGLLGVAYTGIQANITGKTYRYTVTPLLLHINFFNFFDNDNQPEVLEISQFKNVGERLCYNIRGWCISGGNLYQLAFGEIDEKDGQKGFRADLMKVWAEKNNIVNSTVLKPALLKLENVPDNLLLLYDDNEGKVYFSLLTREYKYTTGFLNISKISQITHITQKSLNTYISLLSPNPNRNS